MAERLSSQRLSSDGGRATDGRTREQDDAIDAQNLLHYGREQASLREARLREVQCARPTACTTQRHCNGQPAAVLTWVRST